MKIFCGPGESDYIYGEKMPVIELSSEIGTILTCLKCNSYNSGNARCCTVCGNAFYYDFWGIKLFIWILFLIAWSFFTRDIQLLYY